MKLEYIPFSKLLNPEDAFAKMRFKKEESIDSIPVTNSRALKTIKSQDIRALKGSIEVFGLLNPLFVARITDEMRQYVKVAKWFKEIEYVIVDGQRRYKAIKELFNLKDAKERDDVETERKNKGLSKETRPKIEDHVLIPCVVFPYTEFCEARRHSIEDNKFSVRPKSIYLDHAERSDCGAYMKREDSGNWEKLKKLKATGQIV